MINVNDFKTGVTISYDGNIYQVLEFQHVKPGKGPAFVRSKLKNLRSGAIIENTFNAGIKVEKALVSKKTMQFLYSTGDIYYFMDMNDYEQIEINKNKLGNEAKFLKENLEVDIVFFESEILEINLPDKIDYVITFTEAGVKGNTSTSANKDATIETGLNIKVPLFIEQGESVIVSTKDGKYVSRK